MTTAPRPPLSRLPLASWRAVVLHRPHPAADNVVRQLERLGLTVRVAWPELEPADAAADVILFDADTGYDGQFPWEPGAAPMPMIALIGSEAPGRVEWALAQGSNAHLLKPISSAGVYSALLIAAHAFEAGARLAAEIGALKDRLRKRPQVVRATIALMAEGLDEEAAIKRLRSLAMDRRMSVEEVADEMCERRGRLGDGRRRGGD